MAAHYLRRSKVMEKQRIHLTIGTTAGDLEDDFSLHQKLFALKREVMGKLKLDPSQADDFDVTLDGQILDENKTLEELGIPEDSILVIERKDAIKI